jgi:hypothetical protein
MTPLDPATIRAILNRGGSMDEIAEYQRLLAARFERDPSVVASEQEIAEIEQNEARILELARKLFGEAATQQP